MVKENRKSRDRKNCEYFIFETEKLTEGGHFKRYICRSIDEATEIAQKLQLPLIISGRGLKVHALVKTVSLVDDFSHVANLSKPETPAETEIEPEPEPESTIGSYAIKHAEEPNLWLSDEGYWDSRDRRLYYDSLATAEAIAERCDGVVIDFTKDETSSKR
jgi:hypothetical protein